jgi:hypothetical protein
MKLLYCSNCGTRLTISRKALPNYGVIVDIVNYHECPETPVEFDLKPLDISRIGLVEGKDKFVKSLNELSNQTPKQSIMEVHKKNYGEVDSNDLRDRRFETSNDDKVKTSAPSSVINIIDSMANGE